LQEKNFGAHKDESSIRARTFPEFDSHVTMAMQCGSQKTRKVPGTFYSSIVRQSKSCFVRAGKPMSRFAFLEVRRTAHPKPARVLVLVKKYQFRNNII